MSIKIFCQQVKATFYLPIKLLAAAAFILASCQQANKQQDNDTKDHKNALAAIDQAKKRLKDGTLVTRSDDDFESLTLQNFSKRERAYSHSGIVFKEDSMYVVYHCMAGKENLAGTMRRDPFDSFVNPSQKTGFGIFHYQLSDSETVHFHQLIQQNFIAKTPFDNTFNLLSDDSLYCSEMIYKNLKTASNGRIILPTSVIQNFKPKIMGYQFNKVFFKQFKYIGLDDLYLNPFCKEITRVKY
jgi:hypothetical protein